MTDIRPLGSALSIGLLLAGCTPQTNMPLVFAQAQTVGITANAATTQQSAELTFGYRDMDVAVVPTTITDGGGQVHQLNAEIKSVGPGGCVDDTNGLSVLGQFSVSTVSTATATTPQISLGKFFATGNAAKRLSDGFANQLENSSKTGSTPPAAATTPAATPATVSPTNLSALAAACTTSK